ncbi:hypothetical protein [Rubrivirga litoralis]|uniref:Lipoprotein n=1 Tax=Rubrivirga litoralis TaxID=3075598 RepID=A0ABU3BMC4_9BACT|nr:hypothetical protein [Rubrivirga sp. F394]MDT0630447.1 hypothetical protein [Rubrivirga sp. F394]
MRLALLSALALLAAACAPEPSDVTPDPSADAAPPPADAAFTDAPPPGTEQLVITSTDGVLTLGLTDRVVFFHLSDAQRAEIEKDLAAELETERSGVGGFIAETLTDAVGGVLDRAVQLPVDEVRVVHDGDGRLDIESLDGEGSGTFHTGDDGGPPAFDPADAERFVEAFERVRAGR